MKAAPRTGPNRRGIRYSAADKLKAVKLYLEEGYQAKDIAQKLGIGLRQMDPGISGKRFTQIFRRFLGLPVKTHEV